MLDPQCAMAWWGLSRAQERWGRGDANKSLQKAYELRERASYPEQQLILARMQEKGLVPGVGDGEARKKARDAEKSAVNSTAANGDTKADSKATESKPADKTGTTAPSAPAASSSPKSD